MKTATVKVGGKEYTLTPMTIAESKKGRSLAADFNRMRTAGSATQDAVDAVNEAVVSLVHASIQRADPNVSREELENVLSFQDLFDCLIKIGEISTMAEIPLKSLTNKIQ